MLSCSISISSKSDSGMSSGAFSAENPESARNMKSEDSNTIAEERCDRKAQESSMVGQAAETESESATSACVETNALDQRDGDTSAASEASKLPVPQCRIVIHGVDEAHASTHYDGDHSEPTVSAAGANPQTTADSDHPASSTGVQDHVETNRHESESDETVAQQLLLESSGGSPQSRDVHEGEENHTTNTVERSDRVKDGSDDPQQPIQRPKRQAMNYVDRHNIVPVLQVRTCVLPTINDSAVYILETAIMA